MDSHRTRSGQFLLTGSQKFTLMKNITEALAGRADIVELEMLSFAEIREALPASEVESTIVRGAFPELYANTDIDSVAFYNSYLATYLRTSRTRCARPGEYWQPARLREIPARLRSAFCKPLEQSATVPAKWISSLTPVAT